MLSSKQKLRLTSASSLLMQLVLLVSGFILPRLFLSFYGSAVNGLVSSITQFLWLITLAECGVGAVVQSALYKPLAQKDNIELSKIVVSSEHFFRNIAKVLLLYVVLLVAFYPFIVNNNFDFVFTASLIVIIAASSFAQYYFGITYRLLLNSDQFGFVPLVISMVALLLNVVVSAALMYGGCSIHVVKLASSVVFILQPLLVSFIAHKWYEIDFSIGYDKYSIPQKWNGLAQHVATVVLYSSGVGVLTIFSTLENVSVYTVYSLVVNGVRNITISLTNGMQAFLGNLFAKGDMDGFKMNFESFEWKMHSLVVFAFSITSALIVPFVGVYVKGVNDVNYIFPLFGVLLTFAWGMFCIRLPYNVAVLAVGHYRQTQWSAVIEVCLNVGMSVLFVVKYGLVGVALGTFVAMLYRTVYLAWYISKHVLKQGMFKFGKLLLVDVLSVLIYLGFICRIKGSVLLYEESLAPSTYYEWLFMALSYFGLGIIIFSVINVFFYRKNFFNLFSLFFRKNK